jgi:hypothetical protein
MASTYRLKIGFGDKQFEAEGDKKFVLDIWKKFQEQAGNIKAEPLTKKGQKDLPSEVAVVSRSAKQLSMGEFVRQLGLKKHTDIVLAFGYYLEKISGMREFGPADINKCYYEAKMESSNTSQMLIQNIKRGRIMQAKGGKKGQNLYTLTRTGEDLIDTALNKKKTV